MGDACLPFPWLICQMLDFCCRTNWCLGVACVVGGAPGDTPLGSNTMGPALFSWQSWGGVHASHSRRGHAWGSVMPILEVSPAGPQAAVALAQLFPCRVPGGDVALQRPVPYVEQERGVLPLRGTGLLCRVLGNDPRWQAVCYPSKVE